MSKIRKLPAQQARVETGPVQFGDDWPGVFIRGDNAGYYAMALDALLQQSDKADLLTLSILNGLRDALAGAIVGPAADLVRKPGGVQTEPNVPTVKHTPIKIDDYLPRQPAPVFAPVYPDGPNGPSRPGPAYAANLCPMCGITLDKVMSYFCPRTDCPTGMGPITCTTAEGSTCGCNALLGDCKCKP